MGVRAVRRAVFLDRDGVLNQVERRNGRPHPPASLTDVHLIPQVEECLEELKRLQFLLIVVTNQPDVARGSQSKSVVEEIHEFLLSRLPIDDIYVCYHDDADRCACRKPAPGLLLEAARKHDIQLNDSFLIGDRWRDIEAGTSAQCKTVLIDYGYPEDRPQNAAATFIAHSLRTAVDWILSHA
jgi:D-glycero-D-manno-heptose 1,7-bisphosphate phosphatase